MQIATLFLSDLHMGDSRQAFQSPQLLACLKAYTPKNIIINGDFLSFVAIDPTDPYYKNAIFRRLFPWGWNSTCHAILDRFADLAAQGTEILLLSGNHDHYTDKYLAAGHTHFSFALLPSNLQNCFGITDDRYDHIFKLQKPFIHQSAKGLKIYIEHGHTYSDIPHNHPLVYPLAAYILSGQRRAGWLKYRLLYNLKKVHLKAAATALGQGANATMTGHFHAPDARKVTVNGHPIIYLNTGDWLGNATAIVEKTDGNLSLVSWYDSQPKETPIAHS